MPRAIILNRSDNVATLLDGGRAGDACELQGEGAGQLTLAQDVAFGHKVCIAAIPKDANVLKYGQVIGRATQPIKAGEHTHVHNVESCRRTDLSGR